MSPVKPDRANRANRSLAVRSGMLPPWRTGSVMQNLGQEQLCAFRARLSEKVVLQGVLDDLAAVHEDDAVRDLPGKTHLVRDYHHGHAFAGELDHDVEHLVDHL